MTIETTLAKYEDLTHEIFTADGAIDPILAAIKEQTLSQVYDAEDAKARQAAGGISRKLGGFKTKVDNLGKDFVADAKAQIKTVDNRRKAWKDGIAAIQAEFMKPATEWQAREDARIGAINDLISKIKELGELVNDYQQPLSLAILKANHSDLLKIDLTEDTYQELLPAAQAEWAKSSHAVGGQIAALEEAEAAKLEAERIEKERQAKEQAEREKRIAEEAAAKARAEAVSEQPKVAPEPVQPELTEVKVTPQPTKSNRAIINNEILADLLAETDMTREQAKAVVIAMAQGRIRNLTVNYGE